MKLVKADQFCHVNAQYVCYEGDMFILKETTIEGFVILRGEFFKVKDQSKSVIASILVKQDTFNECFGKAWIKPSDKRASTKELKALSDYYEDVKSAYENRRCDYGWYLGDQIFEHTVFKAERALRHAEEIRRLMDAV